MKKQDKKEKWLKEHREEVFENYVYSCQDYARALGSGELGEEADGLQSFADFLEGEYQTALEDGEVE